MHWFVIIWYLLLLDAVIANTLAFSKKQHWWQIHLGTIAQHFPLARGWTLYYLFLVILMGILLQQTSANVLPW